MEQGDVVDDFELTDQSGAAVRLTDLLADGPLVFFFYPKAMTTGCTKESCYFRDLRSEFAGLGATVVGVSADPVDRQKEFDEKNSLGFPLLSDPDREIARRFGTKRVGPLPTKRSTFVIDTDRSVLAVIRSEIDMTAHADAALTALRARAQGTGED